MYRMRPTDSRIGADQYGRLVPLSLRQGGIDEDVDLTRGSIFVLPCLC